MHIEIESRPIPSKTDRAGCLEYLKWIQESGAKLYQEWMIEMEKLGKEKGISMPSACRCINMEILESLSDPELDAVLNVCQMFWLSHYNVLQRMIGDFRIDPMMIGHEQAVMFEFAGLISHATDVQLNRFPDIIGSDQVYGAPKTSEE